MKKKIALLVCGSILLCPLSLKVSAETPTSIAKPVGKGKEAPAKEVEKDKVVDQNSILKDFLNGTSYNRESVKKLPSPFRNLIVVEKNRIKSELEKAEAAKKKAELDAGINLTETSGVDQKDIASRKFIILQSIRADLEKVQKLTDIRKYEDAEAKLTVMDSVLSKNSIEELKADVAKKKEEVIAEHKDWDEINKILNGLSVDAMFIAEGKKKVALINDIAVEEGDDLNDLLSLSKESPIILTFVSGNSLKIKFKKFTLQKELIDNDL